MESSVPERKRDTTDRRCFSPSSCSMSCRASGTASSPALPKPNDPQTAIWSDFMSTTVNSCVSGRDALGKAVDHLVLPVQRLHGLEACVREDGEELGRGVVVDPPAGAAAIGVLFQHG